MSEGAPSSSNKSGDRATNSSSSSSHNHRAPRGGGRGGRGRGRSSNRGGRSGRGRGGRGRHSSNDDGGANHNGNVGPKEAATANAVDVPNHSNAAAKHNDHNADTATIGAGGRAGRGRGRSRGRGRGRGGGRHGKKGSRSNSPVNGEGDVAAHGHERKQEAEPFVPSESEPRKTTAEAVAVPTETLHNTLAPLWESKPTVPSLPSPPRIVGGRGGVPLILTRNSHQQQQQPRVLVEPIDHDSEAQKLSESMAAAALGDFDMEEMQEEKKDGGQSEESPAPPEIPPSNGTGKHEKPSNKPKKDKKKKNKEAAAPEPPPEEEPADISPTDAFKAIPAQEVSITANTTVQIRRSESTASMNKEEEGPKKITGSGLTAKKKGKSKKKKGLSNDDAANQKAAKAFNKSVRLCVDRSDPESMRDILHDKRNHNFALDKTVLETVMKAYVMAAMFEDALYCLRNCTLPGTLSTIQTERILQCLPQNLRNSSAYTAADMINALCIATEFDSPTSRTYFLRIVRGISLEFLEEVMSARDRICSAPCERLVRSAVCVVDARLKRGKKPTELVVDPGDQLGVFVPDSMENRGIQAGDAVSLLPYAGPYPMSAESLDRNMIEATVTNTNPMVLRLQDKANSSLYAMLTEAVEGNVYRIDKLANRMGFNRQLSAVVATASPLGDSSTRDVRRPSPLLRKAITAMDENIDRVMNQAGGMFKGELTSTAALCAQAVPWNYEDESDDPSEEESFRMASRLALEKYGALEGLNASQRLAVEGAVSNRLTLVQGPPGTGMY